MNELVAPSEREAEWADPKSLPESLRSHYLPADTMQWQATDFPGIEMKLLFSDPSTGMSSFLFKMAPGATVPLHQHTAVEQTYVLSGSLKDDEGEVHAGQFVWRPGGNVHVAYAPNGATFLSFFMKPNRYAAGTKFFTE